MQSNRSTQSQLTSPHPKNAISYIGWPYRSTVVARQTAGGSLDEGDVEDRGVEVDELQEVELQSQTVVVLRLRPVVLHIGQLSRDYAVHLDGKRGRKRTMELLTQLPLHLEGSPSEVRTKLSG